MVQAHSGSPARPPGDPDLTRTAEYTALCDAARVQAWALRDGSPDLIERSFTMRAGTGSVYCRAYEREHGLNTGAAYHVDVTVETFEIPERASAMAMLITWERQQRRALLPVLERDLARMTPGIPGVAYDEHRRYVEHHREIVRCETARRAGSSLRQMAARRRGAGRPRVRRASRSSSRGTPSALADEGPHEPPGKAGRLTGAATSPVRGWSA